MRARSILAMAILFWTSAALGAEVSLISGLYKTEKDKVEGDSFGEKTEIELGGRFADEYDVDMTWFGQANMVMRNYEEPKDGKSPSDSTSLALGGGLRMYFDSFSESIAPFAYGLLMYMNDKDAEFGNGLGYTETETNGLFYSMHTGIRFRYDQVIFMELEVPLFWSALNATTKVETDDGAGTETERESTRTELYFKTDEAFSAVQVVVGMAI